jgi:prepilin-type N-terminal cleavage/methylation domain-containing protein
MKYIFLQKNKKKCIRGFTLVELLVTATIFSFIVITATGALFQAQHLNTRVQNQQIVLDGVNLSMENMVRDIRYGFYYHCSTSAFATSTPPASFDLRNNCPLTLDGSLPKGRTIIFHPVSMSNDGDRVAYYIKRSETNSMIYKATCSVVSGVNCTWQDEEEQITGDDVYVDNLSFFTVGVNSSTNDGTNLAAVTDTLQPMVTIIVRGRTKPTKIGEVPVFFSLQHSVVSRVLDN